MPILTLRPVVRGETPDAAQLNGQYSTLTTALDGQNFARDAVGRQHFATPAGGATWAWQGDTYDTAPDAYNNTSWQPISHGGTDAEANLNDISVAQETVLRAMASVLVCENTVTVDDGVQNYYAFRLVLDWGTGGAATYQRPIVTAGMGFTFRSRVTLQSGGVGDRLNWQHVLFSGLVRAEATEVWKKVRLEVILNDGTANTLSIGGHRINVQVARK